MLALPESHTRVPRQTLMLEGAIIAAAFVVMAAWSWLTWPDVLVDFGRELYIPWQLSSGKALYTDIAYYSGPLSPYLNSLWFTLFGVGLKTLVWANLGILAAFVALLYQVLSELGDHLAATVGCLVFILLFAFAQYVGIGNYNYMCPYSHDAVHGLMLSLLAFYLATKYLSRRSLIWLIGCGLAIGLSFLTRAEVFLPGLLSVAAMLIVDVRRRSESRGRTAVHALVVPACALIPVGTAFLLLLRRMPAQNALIGTLGTWPATISGKAAAMHYFQFQMGTADLAQSLRLIAICVAAYVGIVSAFTLISRLSRNAQAGRNLVMTLAFVLSLIGFLILFYAIDDRRHSGRGAPLWEDLRGLPAVILVFCFVSGAAILRGRDPDLISVQIKRLGILVFALVALGKIILNAHIFHYGFVFAMPAVMVAILMLLNWLPAAIQRRWSGGGAEFRAMSLGLIAAFAFTLLKVEGLAYASKTDANRIDRGVDSFRSDRRAEPVRRALHFIDDVVGPKDTMVALPEGVMLNYLSRRVNPTPHTNWMPTDLIIFGEESAFKSLRDHPPDWIVLVHKDTSEFGFRFFGTDYGREIMDWVRFNYSEVGTIGHRPLETNEFGIQFLKKKPG